MLADVTTAGLFPLSYYAVEYSAAPPLIRGLNLRPLDAEEITVTCEWLLHEALRHHCPYWLLDGRAHVQQQPQSLHDWMREEYFPRVCQVLQALPHIAFLVSPAVWAGLPEKGYVEPLAWHSRTARIGWFTQEAPALAWLGQQRLLMRGTNTHTSF